MVIGLSPGLRRAIPTGYKRKIVAAGLDRKGKNSSAVDFSGAADYITAMDRFELDRRLRDAGLRGYQWAQLTGCHPGNVSTWRSGRVAVPTWVPSWWRLWDLLPAEAKAELVAEAKQGTA